MLKTLLVVWVCALPLEPKWECREVARYEPENPIQCQFDRILVSSAWKDRVREMHGDGWAVLTACGGPEVEKLLEGLGG